MEALQENNYVAILAAVGVGLSVVYMVSMSKKHPLEGPYVRKGIPIIGNFIEFAKGIDYYLIEIYLIIEQVL